jgi:hypothetical protein
MIDLEKVRVKEYFISSGVKENAEKMVSAGSGERFNQGKLNNTLINTNYHS